MTELGFKANRILKRISNSPIIWSGNRDVVQMTLEKNDYADLLRVLSEIESMGEQEDVVSEARRVRI